MRFLRDFLLLPRPLWFCLGVVVLLACSYDPDEHIVRTSDLDEFDLKAMPDSLVADGKSWTTIVANLHASRDEWYTGPEQMQDTVLFSTTAGTLKSVHSSGGSTANPTGTTASARIDCVGRATVRLVSATVADTARVFAWLSRVPTLVKQTDITFTHQKQTVQSLHLEQSAFSIPTGGAGEIELAVILEASGTPEKIPVTLLARDDDSISVGRFRGVGITSTAGTTTVDVTGRRAAVFYTPGTTHVGRVSIEAQHTSLADTVIVNVLPRAQ